MCDVNTAVPSIMTSASLEVVKNISAILETRFVETTNETEMLYENMQELENVSKTKVFSSLNEEEWKNNYLQPAVSVWILQFLRFVGIPVLLFYLTLMLWELRYLRMRDSSNPLSLPPGCMGLPLLGEMLQFFIIGTKYQRDRQKKFGQVYRTHMFGRPTVIAIGDKHVRRLITGEGQIVDTLWPSMTREILGENGIVNGDKQTHATIKRLVLRVFSPKFMGKYAPVVQHGISSHIKSWSGKLPVLELCKQMVSRTMMTVLLGIPPDDPAIRDFIQAADDVVNSIFSLPINFPGFAFRKGINARDFVFKALEEKLRSKIDASDEELFAEADEFESVLLNIIKLARKEKTNIKLINLQNLSLEFIFAGTQSLQCASASMICHLSQRPEIMSRLRDEIIAHGLWEKPMEEVTFEEIQELTLADCVIKETMRVTPSIPGCVRVAKKTFELGGYQVPKGWQVIYSIKLTHESTTGKILQDGPKCFYDPDVYFNCSKCQNKRLNSKESRSTNSSSIKVEGIEKSGDGKSKPAEQEAHVCDKTAGDYSYIPFGKGVRMCAGKNYGMLFLRVMLFELVRTTNFRLASKLKFSAVPMTKPHKSVMIEFEKI